jgi:hypothetical protein
MITKLYHLTPSAIFAALILIFSGVYGNAADARSHAEASLPGQVLTVRLGQTVVLTRERLRIKFTSVVGDSRCPTGVTCVWEGDAEILLAVNRANNAASELRLHTNQRFTQREQYQGYEIALVRLVPYPKSGTRQNLRDYVAVVSVKQSISRDNP